MTVDKIDYINYKVFVFDLDYTLHLHENHTSLYTNRIIELLSLLKEHNKILCIATHNKNPQIYLKQINIENFFDEIISEKKNVNCWVNSIEDFTSKKLMLTEIMNKFNCNQNEIVFFDDSDHNINEVNNLEIKSIKVSSKTGIDISEILCNFN
jgi:HAD superfamily phosphatase (TIGR01681 family)